MRMIVDTSAILCVLLNQEDKGKIVLKTQNAILMAPASLHWEIGNALSSLIKRKKLSEKLGLDVIEEFAKIPIQSVDVDMKMVISLVGKHSIYAYDAYMIISAKQNKIPILSLDKGLLEVARKEKLGIVEV